MARQHHESRTTRARDQQPEPGAVLLLNSDQGAGPRLARALAGKGVVVVLHTTGHSTVTGDLLQEITEAGGRAVAVECAGTDAAGVADVLVTLAMVVGPVAAVLVNPWQAPPETDAAVESPIGLDPQAVAAAESACRWSLAVIEAVPHPQQAAIIGVWPGKPPASLPEAVRRSLWHGLVEGLRCSPAAHHARFLSVTLAMPCAASRSGQGPDLAAARIVELLRQAPRRGEDAGEGRPEHGDEIRPLHTLPSTVARWA